MIKTYPDPIDLWVRSLTPDDGVWQPVRGESLHLNIDPYELVVWGVNESWTGCKLVLNDGKEFDATKQAAQFKVKVLLQTGTVYSAYLVFNDKAGRRARTPYRQWQPTDDGNIHEYVWNLPITSGWEVEAGFDWRFIKTITLDFEVSAVDTAAWIRDPHFVYLEEVLAELVVQSNPSGKSFSIDGVSGTTPSDTLGLEAGVSYTVSIDPADFIRWEDSSTNPARTIQLSEGEAKTIIAYYAGAPPQNVARVCFYASQNGDEVNAKVLLNKVPLGTTPFCIDLYPEDYTFKVSFNGQTQDVYINAPAGEITVVEATFKKGEFNWINVLIAAGVILGSVIVIGAVQHR
jgi:hypothetical protein